MRWAHWRSIAVSIDLSSVSVIESLGVSEVHRLLGELLPDVVFANADEARAMGIESAIGNALTIVKRGADTAMLFRGHAVPVEVPATAVDRVDDTTGAGDAFAAGVLTYQGWRDDPQPRARRASGRRASCWVPATGNANVGVAASSIVAPCRMSNARCG